VSVKLNDSDFEEEFEEEMVDVDYQKRCEKVYSLIRNTTKEEFEEWLAFDNTRVRESLRAGVQKTEQNLKGFEEKYHKNTEKFISEYDKLEETIDFLEWIGEFRMLKRLTDKLETMKSHEHNHPIFDD